MKIYTLKELRKIKNETQENTANAININRSLYSHYENGIRVPRVDIAKKLAKHFNVKVEQIKFLTKNDTNSHVN